MIDWLKEAKEIQYKMITVRRDFHTFPELGNQEYRTTEKIEQYLHALGIETHRVTPTGTVGILHGSQKGKTVVFRSDIDALPIKENTGLSYSSVNENMHACGHDFHMTALLGAAELLSHHKDEIHGDVIFLFQPDEEGDGGAERMIHKGVLEDVDAVFGCHVNPELPTGQIGIRYGPFYAAAAVFRLRVIGKSAHGAEPENGIDALYAGAGIAIAAKQLTGTYEGRYAVVNTGVLQAGTANNVIAEEAFLHGLIRTQGVEMRQMMIDRLKRIIENIKAETGVRVEENITPGYPGVVNHDRETSFVERTARALLPAEQVTILEKDTMTTEDFGYYLLEKPGCFYHLGVNSTAPLHNSGFNPDEEALYTGAAIHAKVLFDYLKE